MAFLHGKYFLPCKYALIKLLLDDKKVVTLTNQPQNDSQPICKPFTDSYKYLFFISLSRLNIKLPLEDREGPFSYSYKSPQGNISIFI